MSGLIEQLDTIIYNALASWNVYSTLALTTIIGILTFTLLTTQEADIHPLILSRQTTATQVRNPGESAVYRSPDVPHGFPLRQGLDVKLKGAPPYAGGQNGDLRDVWRRLTGEISAPPPPRYGLQAAQTPEGKQRILSVMGGDNVKEQSIDGITQEIKAVGEAIGKNGKSVAIYLPNSVEFLTAVFACAFYGLDVTLIPYIHGYDQTGRVLPLLRDSNATVLIAPAGSLPLEQIVYQLPALKQVVWFVEETSRQVDWTEVPNDLGGRVEVDTWHELCQNAVPSTTELPNLTSGDLGTVTMYWQSKSAGDEPRPMTFTHQNLVAAIAAQIHALPVRQRLSSADLVLPADSLAQSYTFCFLLAALFAGASVALNTAVDPTANLPLVTRGIVPTVIVASPEMVSKLHKDILARPRGLTHKLAVRTRTQALANGSMSTGPSFLKGSRDLFQAKLGASAGSVRLILIPERAGAGHPIVSADALHDIRIFTDARVVRVLTAPNVAGAVSQTNMLDYRRSAINESLDVGVPLSCLEVKLVDTAEHKTDGTRTAGEIYVMGPAVVGGETRLGVSARVTDDGTLALL